MTSQKLGSLPVVLIVEDDPDVRDVMTFSLQKRGFEVLSAADKDTAVEIFKERRGKIDVLLADLSLPGDTSGGLARWVASVYPAVKTVYVSGIPRHVALSSGIVRSEVPYLEKPVNPDVLASTIQSLLPRLDSSGEAW
ncbi:response regulator [Actinoplanes sp. NPDC051494]|uniref:response regulator n=1 Tax=Actinoplanes sp. NPDC051494 TaxID=3363907 RepID=UPI0037B22903